MHVLWERHEKVKVLWARASSHGWYNALHRSHSAAAKMCVWVSFMRPSVSHPLSVSLLRTHALGRKGAVEGECLLSSREQLNFYALLEDTPGSQAQESADRRERRRHSVQSRTRD